MLSSLHEDIKGQALIEFIVFLPFMLIMYGIIISITNAINGSINQQKFTRGYFYNTVQNDSYMPIRRFLLEMRGSGVTSSGAFALGWKEKSINRRPVAPCYKIMTIMSSEKNEKCDPGEMAADTTQFIRVKTVYGICGASYDLNSDVLFALNTPGIFSQVALTQSCINI